MGVAQPFLWCIQSSDAPLSQKLDAKAIRSQQRHDQLAAHSAQAALCSHTDLQLPLLILCSSILHGPASAGMQLHGRSAAGMGYSSLGFEYLTWEGCLWPPALGTSQPQSREHFQAVSPLPAQGHASPRQRYSNSSLIMPFN